MNYPVYTREGLYLGRLSYAHELRGRTVSISAWDSVSLDTVDGPSTFELTTQTVIFEVHHTTSTHSFLPERGAGACGPHQAYLTIDQNVIPLLIKIRDFTPKRPRDEPQRFTSSPSDSFRPSWPARLETGSAILPKSMLTRFDLAVRKDGGVLKGPSVT